MGAKIVSADYFRKVGYWLPLGGEGLAVNFPGVRVDGCEEAVGGQNFGCPDRDFFFADGSWGVIADLALADSSSGAAIQPIEEQLRWLFGRRLDLCFGRSPRVQSVEQVTHCRNPLLRGVVGVVLLVVCDRWCWAGETLRL